MKRKVAIFTLNGYSNYGNRLQNYALQEVLKSFDLEVETVLNHTKNQINNRPNTIERMKRLLSTPPNKVIKRIKRRVAKKFYKSKLVREREVVFKRFTKKHISETDFIITEQSALKNLSSNYDLFVTGSDQVWNPHYRGGSPVDFLQFAPRNKRITYAPSFGISNIPNEYIKNYQKWLSEIDLLSVREHAGANIIKSLTGIEAPVLLDPTMLLTKEQWLSIAKMPSNKPSGRYLLTYFLGETPKERKKWIEQIANKNNLKIINLAQHKERETYLAGPSEFIYYINSSALFCTDSFHGGVFSILFETPFLVFNRESTTSPAMNSRFETLLNTFSLQTRLAENIKSNRDLFDVDFSKVYEVLEAERIKADIFLKNSLKLQ